MTDPDTISADYTLRPSELAAIVLLQVDAAVQDEEHYAPGELPEEIVVKGRWGTDFRPGFARLAEQGIQPAVCLYFTDMDCDRYPEVEPPFPLAWIDWSPRDAPLGATAALGRAHQDRGLTFAGGTAPPPPRHSRNANGRSTP